MSSKSEIIFEPAYTPNQNWVKELDHRHMDSSFSSFRAPKNDTRIITLCKPFVVFSKNSYSSPPATIIIFGYFFFTFSINNL